MGKSSRWIGWGVGVVLGVGWLGLAASAEPDPDKVREAMKRYIQQTDPPKPKPKPKPEQPKPRPKPRPAVATERPAPVARLHQRFTDNNNGTITDNRTGLVWLKNANCFGRQDWYAAMASAPRLSNGYCGLRDGSVAGQWRLPSKEEWEALIDKSSRDPALPMDHPFTGVQPYGYWSSTKAEATVGSVGYVNLNNGLVYWALLGGISNAVYVWPVRGGR